MQTHDNAAIGERVDARRLVRADGITTVPESVALAVEFRVRRWESEADYDGGAEPYLETRDGDAALSLAVLTNTGGLFIWKQVRGDTPVAGQILTNANAKLVVSNVTGSPAATDTTVVNEIGRKGMDTSFPLVPGESAGGVTAASRQFVLRGTFGSTDANGDWRRFWVVNSRASEEVFDNFSSNQGTKVSGQVWELTVTLTIT